MIIEDKKETLISEKIKEERDKQFKENGIDTKIDRDLNNKRSSQKFPSRNY